MKPKRRKTRVKKTNSKSRDLESLEKLLSEISVVSLGEINEDLLEVYAVTVTSYTCTGSCSGCAGRMVC
jgi:hypothetical protein